MVVHEDGNVTYIGGCSDSPERVAEVNAINKAKREKEVSQRKESLERSQEEADARRKLIEIQYHKRVMSEVFSDHIVDAEINYQVTGQSQVMASAVSAYENAVSAFSGSVTNFLTSDTDIL